MKIINIKSSILPDLRIPTKEMINLGIWFLYSINNNYYLLVTDEKNYILNNFGLVISERIDKSTNDLDIENIIHFSDILIDGFKFN